ncbi:hypothetical protein ACFQ3Z_15090 [Streptomyces nogalater]
MAQPVVLLGAAGEICGEFPLARVAAARPVLLVDPFPPAWWARPYVTARLPADPDDVERTAGALRGYSPAAYWPGPRSVCPRPRVSPPGSAYRACRTRRP